MLREVTQRLARVRRRQRLMRSIRWMTVGLFVGTLLALATVVLARIGFAVSFWAAPISVGVTALSAGIAGLLAPTSWSSAAAVVDRHYGLKDRALTALQFAGDGREDPLRTLQVADAVEKINTIDASAVIPWKRPRWLIASLVVGVAVVAVMLAPLQEPAVGSVSPQTRQLLIGEADYLDETMLEELREWAEDERNPEIKELVQELEELVDTLRDKDADEREALASLSMMQQSIAAKMAEFNLEQVDAALRSIASAIDSAESLRPVAADLKEGRYDEAADQLEQVDPNELTNRESRAVAGNLAKLADDLAKAGQGQLSESAADLGEGFEKKDAGKCKSGAKRLAKLCRTQSLRKSLCQCLGSQLDRLSLCKGKCNGNGGDKVAKSDSPSSSWGTGATNQPLGDEATRLDSIRRQEQVSGMHGEGPSEREVVTTAEAEQLAARGYQERYREFRKRAEAVLETEPLPLGHRQTVRQYFERIRPNEE